MLPNNTDVQVVLTRGIKRIREQDDMPVNIWECFPWNMSCYILQFRKSRSIYVQISWFHI